MTPQENTIENPFPHPANNPEISTEAMCIIERKDEEIAELKAIICQYKKDAIEADKVANRIKFKLDKLIARIKKQ